MTTLILFSFIVYIILQAVYTARENARELAFDQSIAAIRCERNARERIMQMVRDDKARRLYLATRVLPADACQAERDIQRIARESL